MWTGAFAGSQKCEVVRQNLCVIKRQLRKLVLGKHGHPTCIVRCFRSSVRYRQENRRNRVSTSIAVGRRIRKKLFAQLDVKRCFFQRFPSRCVSQGFTHIDEAPRQRPTVRRISPLDEDKRRSIWLVQRMGNQIDDAIDRT